MKLPSPTTPPYRRHLTAPPFLQTDGISVTNLIFNSKFPKGCVAFPYFSISNIIVPVSSHWTPHHKASSTLKLWAPGRKKHTPKAELPHQAETQLPAIMTGREDEPKCGWFALILYSITLAPSFQRQRGGGFVQFGDLQPLQLSGILQCTCSAAAQSESWPCTAMSSTMVQHTSTRASHSISFRAPQL